MKTVGLVALFIQAEHMSVKGETKASVESRSCAKSIRVRLTVIKDDLCRLCNKTLRFALILHPHSLKYPHTHDGTLKTNRHLQIMVLRGPEASSDHNCEMYLY